MENKDASTKTYYFKVVHGYRDEQYITVTQDELPKVYHAFLFGSDDDRIRIGETALRVRDIIRIEPDWHTEEGWNHGYRMDEYDRAHVQSKSSLYKKVQYYARTIAEIAQKEDKPQLLSLPLRETTRAEGLQGDNRLTSDLAKKLTYK